MEVVSKMARRSGSDAKQLDLAVNDRRRCKNNFLSFLSCIDKRTKEGSDRGNEVGIEGEAGKSQSL